MTFELRHLCLLLEIFDMPSSLRFYRDVLGFELVQTASYGMKQVYAKDPDSFTICFQWEAPQGQERP